MANEKPFEVVLAEGKVTDNNGRWLQVENPAYKPRGGSRVNE